MLEKKRKVQNQWAKPLLLIAEISEKDYAQAIEKSQWNQKPILWKTPAS